MCLWAGEAVGLKGGVVDSEVVGVKVGVRGRLGCG